MGPEHNGNEWHVFGAKVFGTFVCLLISLFMLSLVRHGSVHNSHKIGSKHVKIFIPTLPEKYLYGYFKAYYKNQTSTDYEYRADIDFGSPLGLPIDGDIHIRNTNQFSSDLWFYVQLLESPLRVHNYEDADLVFVPAPFSRVPKASYMAQFMDEYPNFLTRVHDKPHVIGYTRVAWDNKDQIKRHPGATPFLFTTIETFYNMETEYSNNLVVIPYPAHVHFSRGYVRQPFDSKEVANSKSLLVSQSFRSRLPLREMLRQQCLDRPEDCAHHEFQSENNGTEFMVTWELTKKSWYCFQPAGDTITRRAMFDCILAGSIPVVFDFRIFSTLPFPDLIPWRDLLVWIAQGKMQSGNIVDILKAQHDPHVALRRLEKLYSIANVLQYGLNPLHELLRFDYVYDLQREDDAFTASLKAVVRKLCDDGKIPQRRCLWSREYGFRHVGNILHKKGQATFQQKVQL